MVERKTTAAATLNYELSTVFPMRLNRFLAAAGVGSRRYCDELIAAGRVRINGQVCTNFSAQPATRDHVKVDGKLVHADRPFTIMLHKPAGFVSTRKDANARASSGFIQLSPHVCAPSYIRELIGKFVGCFTKSAMK